MSRLEKFIKENRDAFDDEMPSKELWQKVEATIPAKDTVVLNIRPLNGFKWSIAASVVLLTGIAVFFAVSKINTPATNTVSTGIDTGTSEIASVAPETAPEVSQFAKLIAVKQEELKELSREQPELYQKFANDINQLDSSYRTLKRELYNTPNKEMLIEAMVQNLQLQLNVLNQQLNIINQIKTKKYSHEKNKNFT